MDEDEMQQFSLRWHNHQNSIIGALGRMLSTGALTDVTLSASGTSVKAHRLVLASCSQYFAQLFKRISDHQTEQLSLWLNIETAKKNAFTFKTPNIHELNIWDSRYFLREFDVGPIEKVVQFHGLIIPLKKFQHIKLDPVYLIPEVEAENNTLVIVLSCEVTELRLLLTFMYTGEVTASKKILPSLLRLAQTLKVSGLTDADTNSTLTPTETEAQEENESNSPINLELKTDAHTEKTLSNDNSNSSSKLDDVISPEIKEPYGISDFMTRSDKDRLSKLDQIVQNLYSTHKIGNPTVAPATPPIPSLRDAEQYDRKYRINSSVCTICNKRLSNQYNLRVHMETHAGRRHACRACSHVSRSRDALRKHVAYRHARADTHPHPHRGDL